MQVSAFGSDTETDHLDNWEVQSGGSPWMRDGKVRNPHILPQALLETADACKHHSSARLTVNECMADQLV